MIRKPEQVLKTIVLICLQLSITYFGKTEIIRIFCWLNIYDKFSILAESVFPRPPFSVSIF